MPNLNKLFWTTASLVFILAFPVAGAAQEPIGESEQTDEAATADAEVADAESEVAQTPTESTAEPDSPSAESSWANALYQKVRPSIFLIRCGNAEGTGFLFHSKKHIATAFHVISGGEAVTVITHDGKEAPARVVAWDDEWDLAILEIATASSAPVLKPVSAGQGRVGDPVVAVGNPWGAEQRKRSDSSDPVWAMSQGVISAPPAEWIQTDAPVNPGNSGGPLLTQHGEVVGVLVVRVAGSDGISFAIASSRIAKLAEKIGKMGTLKGEVWRLDWHLAWVPLAEHELSGVLFGPHLVFDRRWGIGVRAARLWSSTEPVSTLLLRDRDRWLGEAELFFRAGPRDGSAVRLGVGVARIQDTIEDRQTALVGNALTQTKAKTDETRHQLLFSIGVDTENVLVDVALYALGDGDTHARLGLAIVF